MNSLRLRQSLRIILLGSVMLVAGCGDSAKLDDDPKQFEAYLYKGSAYLKKGDPQMALPALRRAMEMNPNHGELLGLLGLTYDQLGQSEQALPLLRRALEQAPGDGGLLNNLGTAYLHLQKFDEAERCFNDAIKDAKWSASEDALFNLALVQRGRGKEDLMLEMFKRALALNPFHLTTHMEMATYFQRRGKLSLEQHHLQSALTQHPDNIFILDRLANSYVGSGEPLKARPIFQKIITLAPDSDAAKEAGKRLMKLGG